MHGKGILRMMEGEMESYEGHFKEGQMEGMGCVKLRSGKMIIARWI